MSGRSARAWVVQAADPVVVRAGHVSELSTATVVLDLDEPDDAPTGDVVVVIDLGIVPAMLLAHASPRDGGQLEVHFVERDGPSIDLIAAVLERGAGA